MIVNSAQVNLKASTSSISDNKPVNCQPFLSFLILVACLLAFPNSAFSRSKKNRCWQVFHPTKTWSEVFFNNSNGTFKVLQKPIELLNLPAQYKDQVRYIEFLPKDSNTPQGQYEVVTANSKGQLNWHALKITQNSMHFSLEKTKQEIYELLEQTNGPLLLSQKIKYLKTKLGSLVTPHFVIAARFNSKLEYRVKDHVSLKYKLFNRVKSNFQNNKRAKAAKNFRPLYKLSDIVDVVAIRHVVDATSPLLKSNNDISYYRNTLGIEVVDVEHINKNSGYRATHLTLKDKGVPYEVQLVSNAMSLWHTWDHERVYKKEVRNSSDRQNFNNISLYSMGIAKKIQEIEQRLIAEPRPASHEIQSLKRSFIRHNKLLQLHYNIDSKDALTNIENTLTISNSHKNLQPELEAG